MGVLVRPRLALLVFVICYATGPQVASGLPGVARAQGAIIDSWSNQREQDGEADGAILMRREDVHAANLPSVVSVDGPDVVKVQTADNPEDKDVPCTELLALESVSEDGSRGSPGASRNAAQHTAASLNPDAGAKLGPCDKLSKQLTPLIARGHVAVKDPDGNVSQVSFELPDAKDCDGCPKTPQASKPHWIFGYIMNGCGACIFFGFLTIMVSRLGQNGKAKKLIADRQAAKDTTVEGHALIMEALKAAGASVGAIANQEAAFKKAQEGRVLEAEAKARRDAAAAAAATATAAAAAAGAASAAQRASVAAAK